MLPIVILAGGLATRLRPVTETVPKAMIPVLGVPFIDHQLKLVKQAGFSEVYLCLGYLGEQVEAYVGDGSRYDLTIHYHYDGEKLLGTAGAIRRILDHLPDAFMVMYGDSYLLCDYQAAQDKFLSSGKKALMTVFHNQGLWDKSNIVYRDDEILVYDKKMQLPEMHYIDYGLGAFKRTAFEKVPANEFFDLADVYQTCLAEGQLAAFEVTQRFFEVGSFDGINDIEEYLKCRVDVM